MSNKNNMQKVFILFFILFISSAFSSFQKKAPKETIQWITLEEAEEKFKQEPRPILIDLYTDWCGWCKVMEKKTYSNQSLTKYLNQKFYAVKLNAETKKEITWHGKTYNFNPKYKTNDIALTLTKGELAYPTTVFIPATVFDPQPVAGYLELKEMEVLTKYFGENKYGTVPFDEYSKKFKSSW